MSDEVICDHAEICKQKLVVCVHQKPHSVERLNTKLQCVDDGYCSVAEINCRCIVKEDKRRLDDYNKKYQQDFFRDM